MMQTQKALDRQTSTILTAFGLVCVAWLIGGPVDQTSTAYAMLLPSVLVYEVGRQCAGKAPGGRE